MFRSRYSNMDFVFEFAVRGILFVVFLVEFENVVEFVCTYRIGRFFDLRESHPPSEIRFHCLLSDMTRWSVISPAVFLVMYTEKSLESTKIAFFRLDSLVLGARPKCASNGVFLVSECFVNLRTYSALFMLLRRFRLSSRLAKIKFFSDWIVRWTNSVPVCKLRYRKCS